CCMVIDHAWSLSFLGCFCLLFLPEIRSYIHVDTTFYSRSNFFGFFFLGDTVIQWMQETVVPNRNTSLLNTAHLLISVTFSRFFMFTFFLHSIKPLLNGQQISQPYIML